jgi:hypothetical protein
MALSHGFAATSNLCVSTNNSKMNVDGLYSLPLYASRGADPRPHVVYLHVVPRIGASRHNLSDDRAALTCYRWLGNQPQVLWTYVRLFSSVPCRLGVVAGCPHGRGMKLRLVDGVSFPLDLKFPVVSTRVTSWECFMWLGRGDFPMPAQTG